MPQTDPRPVPAAAAEAQRSPIHVPLVDALRGFAALSVLVYHVIEHFKWTEFPISGPLVWFRLGFLGVDLFFAISGLVIGLSAFSLIGRTGTPGFMLPFLQRRRARIAPLHWLTCLVFATLVMPQTLLQPNLWENALAHLAFVHNLDLTLHSAINGVNWSLAVEMQFYLLMLLLAPLLLRRHWWITILAMVLGAVAWRLGAQMLILIDGPMGVFPLFVAVTQLPGTLDGFAAGLVLARLVVDPRAGRLLAAGRRHPWIPLLATILLWWGVMALFWSNDADWSTWWTVALWRCGVALAMGAVVATACCASGRILTVATAPLRYLGVISYGIYLWHLPVIEALHRIGPIAAPHALTIVLPVTLIFAAGSWHVFETPILERFGRGPIRAPRPASALPQQAT